MKIQAITLFPEMFQSITEYGVTGRAHKQGIWQFHAINPRQFADNKLGYIDDRPFGGGVGMVMMAEPLLKAIDLARQNGLDNLSGSLKNPASPNQTRVIYLSPQGAPLTHDKVKSLSELDNLILLCGRYEGVDERVLQNGVDEEISIGDFVVSGGELPAMMLMDAVLRLVPNVLGDSLSAEQDSFANGLLDCPHYTRPFDLNANLNLDLKIQDSCVPEILLSGNHAEIAKWRLKQSLKRTLLRRPDLLEKRDLIPQEIQLLQEIQRESTE